MIEGGRHGARRAGGWTDPARPQVQARGTLC